MAEDELPVVRECKCAEAKNVPRVRVGRAPLFLRDVDSPTQSNEFLVSERLPNTMFGAEPRCGIGWDQAVGLSGDGVQVRMGAPRLSGTTH